jgi:hypothetical protein
VSPAVSADECNDCSAADCVGEKKNAGTVYRRSA